MGVGGIGINAVQGAAHAGAPHVIAVDPVAIKRETALGSAPPNLRLTSPKPTAFARSVTNGQGADRPSLPSVSSPANTSPRRLPPSARAGTVVVTGVWNPAREGFPVIAR